MNNKMVLNIMIAYFVILSIVLGFQLTRLNDKDVSAPSNDNAVLTEDRLNNAVVFYNDSPVILSNKQQMIVDRTNPSYTPVIKNSIAYLPVSFFGTVYGANVSNNVKDTSATIRLDNKALVMDAKETTLIDNSNEKELDAETKPMVYHNTVYVPADVFAEAFNKEVYIYGNMGILSGSEFSEEDNTFLNGLVSQVNDLPYISNENNLRSVTNISSTDDIFSNVEKKIKEFENHSASLSVRALSADNSDILTSDDTYIYFGGTGRVEIMAKNDSISKAAEITMPDKFTTKKIILQGTKLIVIGNNSDTVIKDSEDGNSVYMGNVSTDVYIYNIADIKNISQIRSYRVSGYYQNVSISGEYIYLLSRNTVYGLYNNDKFNAPVYVDSVSGQQIIDFDMIQYFPEIGSEDVTIVSSINMDLTSQKPNVRAFVGAGSNTYISQNNFYVSKSRYTAFEDYESVENNCIYRYAFANGAINKAGQAIIKGNLINPMAISENNGYCRLVTKFTDSETNTKVCNAYVLNNNLEVCGQASEVAKDEDISNAIFSDKEILLAPAEVGGNIFVIDIENPASPKGKGALKLTDGNLAIYPYDENTVIGIDNGNGVLKIGMYDLSDLKNPKKLFSQELGKNDIISTTVFENPKGFIFDKEKNIMVLPVKITGETVFEGAYVYNVYRDEGFTRLTNVDAKGLLADCITKGKLIMFSNEQANVYALDSKDRSTIEFKKVEKQ